MKEHLMQSKLAQISSFDESTFRKFV